MVTKKTALASLLAFLGAAAIAHAQQWPNYYGRYFPAYPQSQYPYSYYNPYPPAGTMQGDAGSNFVYERYSSPDASTGNQAKGSQNAPAAKQNTPYYMQTQGAPAAAQNVPYYMQGTPATPPPVYYDPLNPYGVAAAQVNPPPVVRRQEPAWQGPPLADDTIPYFRTCNEKGWVDIDYMGAFSRPMRLAAPLATVGSATDTNPGALGQPGTQIVYGSDPINFGLFSGPKVQVGCCLDDTNHLSLDVGGFWLLQNLQMFSLQGNSAGFPVIARPIYDTAFGTQRSVVDSFPGSAAFPFAFSGGINIESKSELGGAELNLRYHCYSGPGWHFEALAGFRYLRLEESLSIQDHLTPITPNVLTFQGVTVNSPITDQDLFQTTNQFFGGQIGGRLACENKYCFFDVYGKVGVGATVENVYINGSSTLQSPTGNVTVPGGVLALPTNIGDHQRTTLGFVPELGLNFGVNITPHMRVKVGYSALFWNRVVRAGGEFDPSVNSTLIPTSPNFGAVTGPLSPTFRFNDEFFWVQSFNLGLEYRF